MPLPNLPPPPRVDWQLANTAMLKFLLAHPEYSFSPPEVVELCEAFDAALVALHEEHRSINWSADKVTAALAAEIAESRLRGESDPKRLRDNAIRMAKTLFETAAPEPPQSGRIDNVRRSSGRQ